MMKFFLWRIDISYSQKKKCVQKCKEGPDLIVEWMILQMQESKQKI